MSAIKAIVRWDYEAINAVIEETLNPNLTHHHSTRLAPLKVYIHYDGTTMSQSLPAEAS